MTAARPAWPRQLRALLLKDLRLELRTRDTIVAMVLFAVLAMLIFQFAFGNRGDDLTPYAGGILWATLSLNIPDFSRYAYSQRDQALGQAIGLPTTMALFSFIGVAVTSAAFGAGHLLQGVDAALATGLLGAFWGVVYLRRRSALAPMVSHAGFDLVQIAAQVMAGGRL